MVHNMYATNTFIREEIEYDQRLSIRQIAFVVHFL